VTYRIGPGADILTQADDYRASYGEWASGYDLVGAMAVEVARLRKELKIRQEQLDLACRCLRGQIAAMQEAGDAVAYVQSMLAAGRLAEAEGALDTKGATG